MKSTRRGGLGRGLGALIPTGPAPGVASGPSQLARPQGAAADVHTTGEHSVPEPAAPVSRYEEQLAPVPGARFAEIPVSAIAANQRQPRQVFDEEALEELKASIQEVGLLQPIVVRETTPERYELVMGERR